MNQRNTGYLFGCVAMLTCFWTPSSHAGVWSDFKDLSWEDGRTRLELQGWTGIRSGRRSRSGDRAIAGSIERDFRLGHKLTVGARVIPLFYYEADAAPAESYPETDIWGAGFGFTFRYYFEEAQDGLYLEVMESLIGQSDKFSGNSGGANFMTEAGFGYEFGNDWHVSAKWRHLSNAGIADRNAGINAVGIGIGKSF